MSDWQPIETAPRGEPVDLWAAERDRYANERIPNCRHKDGRWVHTRTIFDDEDMADESDEVEVFNPTHWRPVPDAPDVP